MALKNSRVKSACIKTTYMKIMVVLGKLKFRIYINEHKKQLNKIQFKIYKRINITAFHLYENY